MRIDDLREELRAQARQIETWEVPAVRRAPRRTPRRPAQWAAVVVAVALVVAVLAVPVLLLRPAEDREPAASAPEGPRLSVGVDWTPRGPSCAGTTPECQVPAQLTADGLDLDRSLVGAGDALDAPGAPTYYDQEVSGGGPGDLWLLVGVIGAQEGGRVPSVSLDFEGTVAARPVEGRGLTLVHLELPGDLPDPLRIRVEADRPQLGGRLVIAHFEPAQAGPRADWEATLAACRAAGPGCVAPAAVRVGGLDLVRSPDGAEGTGSLRGRLDRPRPDAWFMLGTSETDADGSLVVQVGDLEPVTVPVGRPVLVRAPEGAPLAYAVRTEDGRALPLFMWLYEPAD